MSFASQYATSINDHSNLGFISHHLATIACNSFQGRPSSMIFI